MALLSIFLSYLGSAYFLYHSSIAIYLKSSKSQIYESYPNKSVDIYTNLLMKWLCFILYLSLEDIFLVLFEIVPLGTWILLVFKLYLISPRSEVHLKFFRRTFSYFQFQEDFINISFYGSLLAKHLILCSLKINLITVKFLRKQHLEEIEQHFSKFLNQLNQKTDEKESLIEELELKKEKSIEFIHGNKIDDDSSSQFKESPSKIEENGLNKDQPSKKPGKKKKIILTSKDLNNKNKMGAFAGVLKPKAKKTETKKENEEKEGNTQNQLKDEEVKEIPDRKRFIEAGIFDAEVSVQTKDGSKLNPELYQEFKALVVLPEKTFILKNLDNESEFLRKPLKELKMISNVSLLIKVVYYIEDSEEKIKSNSITGNYSMKLKSKKDYDEWFLPISLFLQREQFI